MLKRTVGISEYELMSFDGKYALLRILSNTCTPYVVATNFNFNDFAWGSGVYFKSQNDAHEHFLSLIMNKE